MMVVISDRCRKYETEKSCYECTKQQAGLQAPSHHRRIRRNLSVMETFTLIHVGISLVAILAGFVVLFGMLTAKRFDRWTVFFLATTALTSLTGFFFPFHGVTPAIVVGIISLAVLAVAFYARYSRQLAGKWRKIYVI